MPVRPQKPLPLWQQAIRKRKLEEVQAVMYAPVDCLKETWALSLVSWSSGRKDAGAGPDLVLQQQPATRSHRASAFGHLDTVTSAGASRNPKEQQGSSTKAAGGTARLLLLNGFKPGRPAMQHSPAKHQQVLYAHDNSIIT